MTAIIAPKHPAPRFLTNDDIINYVPAAGALAPVEKASSRYSFVPTTSVVDALRDVGWFPIDARQSNPRLDTRQGFQQHLIRFARQEATDLNGERVDLLLWNSHDLGSAFKLFAGVWRFVCGNGLMVGSELMNFRHKHVGFNMEELLGSALKIANHAGVVAQQIDDMKTIDMTPDEQGVYAMAAHNLVYRDQADQAPVTPDALLHTRRYDDSQDHLWATFNVVQENIIKGGLRGSKVNEIGRRRKVTTRPVKALDRSVQLNQALWVLTEGMAAIKRGADPKTVLTGVFAENHDEGEI